MSSKGDQWHLSTLWRRKKWISLLEPVADSPHEKAEEAEVVVESLEKLRDAGALTPEQLIAGARQVESIGQSVSAFEVWAPGWVKTSAANFSQIKGLGGALTALGLFGDISTLFSPEDGGVLGTVDRLDAGANAALLAWGFVAVEPIPVVGQVALVATGLYLAGDYVANHWDTIKRWAGNVGHWASSAASKVGDVMGGVVLTVGGGIGNAWDWVWS